MTIQLTPDDRRALGRLCTRNEAGRHFYEFAECDLGKMEEAGLIRIHRPIHHPTGIPYSREYHSIEVNPLVATWFDNYGNLYDEDEIIEIVADDLEPFPQPDD